MVYKILSYYIVDIDECSEETPCDQNAECTNTDGSFNCSCMTGYTGNGTHCTGTSLSFPLCVYTWSSYSCLINTDVDECLQDDTCPPHSTCMNAVGTFSCTCNEGFSLSNLTCEGETESSLLIAIYVHHLLTHLFF